MKAEGSECTLSKHDFDLKIAKKQKKTAEVGFVMESTGGRFFFGVTVKARVKAWLRSTVCGDGGHRTPPSGSSCRRVD